ncbi:HD domain-containing phosphohydrolase [Methylomonas sp. AM2-LC]|uniref:response regulator n=1 Tax=Methylomonas sp. AM2-LC TaxID=3153301 RepID=UPI0032678FD3
MIESIISETPHILIVDDVAENIQLAMNILQEDDYEFSFADSGEKAITLINENNVVFDLILLDIMMPGKDGFQICKEIKSLPNCQDVPVIFLSAKTDVDSITKGFECKGVDYISKPFHASELLARVRTHLELYGAKKILKTQNVKLEIKSQVERLRLLTELEQNQKEMIYILTEVMESTSDETGKHIKRMAELSRLLAKLYPSLNDEDIDTIFNAAPMHDIGKIMIPAEILHKPGRYTDAEFEVMKQHSGLAYQLLSRSPRKLMKAAAIIAHEHHEKWDGSGYPRGLKGADIHIYGRIVALADVFDALTHSRRYKNAWSITEAVDYIKSLSGSHFDPELVDIFIQHIDEFIAIAAIE